MKITVLTTIPEPAAAETSSPAAQPPGDAFLAMLLQCFTAGIGQAPVVQPHAAPTEHGSALPFGSASVPAAGSTSTEASSSDAQSDSSQMTMHVPGLDVSRLLEAAIGVTAQLSLGAPGPVPAHAGKQSSTSAAPVPHPVAAGRSVVMPSALSIAGLPQAEKTESKPEADEVKLTTAVQQESKPAAPNTGAVLDHTAPAPGSAGRVQVPVAQPTVLPQSRETYAPQILNVAPAGGAPSQPVERQQTNAGSDPRRDGGGKENATASQTHREQSSLRQVSASAEQSASMAPAAAPAPRDAAAQIRPVTTDLNALMHAAKIQQPGATLDVTIAPEVHAATTTLSELSRSVVDQVVHGVSLHVAEKTSEIRIALQPESLGDVLVTVKMDDGSMHAKIDVQTTAVKTILETHLPVLRESLSDRGVEFQRIQINAEQHSTLRDPGTSRDQHQQSKPARPYLPDETGDTADPLRTLGYNTMEVTM